MEWLQYFSSNVQQRKTNSRSKYPRESYIFFQFHAISGKQMAKIICLCLHILGWRLLSGKSWIRHCKGIDHLDQEERQVFNLPDIGSLNFRYRRFFFRDTYHDVGKN